MYGDISLDLLSIRVCKEGGRSEVQEKKGDDVTKCTKRFQSTGGRR
jgi:hypothetical protein